MTCILKSLKNLTIKTKHKTKKGESTKPATILARLKSWGEKRKLVEVSCGEPTVNLSL